MTLDTRPPHPDYDLAEGYEWRVEPDEGPLDWRVATDEEAATRRCRHSTRRPCPNPPVAALIRGLSRPTTYFYCADHMYGRWVENGHVLWWAVRRIGS